MFEHRSLYRVLYSDTDRMGYLYYGRYAELYEIGRVEAMRSLGISYRALEDDFSIGMPVMYMQSRYIRPALYDDLITIETQIRKLPKDAITFHVVLYGEDQKIIHYGEVKLCFIHMVSKQRINVPDFILKRLKPHFED